jgi:hypothetical protein
MTDPNTLSATNIGATVQLTWVAASPADGHQVYRKGAVGDYALIGTVASPGTTFNDTTATPGATYSYRVRGFSACGYSGYATVEDWDTNCSTPGTVSGVFASQISGSTVRVQWNNVTSETGFTVERSVDGGGYSSLTTTLANVTSYDDTTVTIDHSYAYKITAFNNCASSDAAISNTVNVECLTIAGPPAGLTATALSQTQIQVDFDKITLPGGGHPTNYVIQQRPGDDLTWTTIKTVTDYESEVPYTNTGLTPGDEYCYRVAATGGDCLNTDYSSEVCQTTLNSLPCDSPETTFEWTVARTTEPGGATGQATAENYLSESPVGSIDMSDPRLVKVKFGAGSDLDDILILVKDTETVTQVWDGIPNHEVEFVIPDNSIIFSNTYGFYINDVWGTATATAKKTFSDSTHRLVLPYGANDLGDMAYDGDDLDIEIFGLEGACSSMNGSYHLIKISDTLWHQNSSGSGAGWFLRQETIGGTLYWAIEFTNTSTLILYIAPADGNATPPTDTRQWKRYQGTGCQNSQGPNGMSYQDFVSTGFVIRDFASGVTKADLETYGFINGSGTFNFRFYHVVCGSGHALVKGLTCSDGNDTSTGCTSPNAPTNLTAALVGNKVTLSWTDNSSDEIGFAVQRLDDIADEWIDIYQTDADVTTYVDYVTAGSYAYRVKARKACGDSDFSNSASVTAPCVCGGSSPNPLPSTIRIRFDDITGCSCFATSEGGSSKATIVSLAGPYTLSGDGTTYTGIGGMASLECHTSGSCGDPSPITYSGPVNITVTFSGLNMTVSAVFNNACCSGSAPTVFHASKTLPCYAGLFSLSNQAESQDDCACLLVGSAYGGSAVVEVACNCSGCTGNTYTATFKNLTPCSTCLDCGDGTSVKYVSDSVEGQTFTLTRDTIDETLFKYETAVSLPIDIRHYSANSTCSGGYETALKFGVYLTFPQSAGNTAKLSVKAFFGEDITEADEVMLFENEVGVTVENACTFIIPNNVSECSADFVSAGTAYVMTGGAATVNQNCDGSSSSSSSSSFTPCDCEGSGVTVCGSCKRAETDGAKMLATVQGVTVCDLDTCKTCNDGTYQSFKVMSLFPNQSYVLTYSETDLAWTGVLPCLINYYTSSNCSGSPAATVTQMEVVFKSGTNEFSIQSAELNGSRLVVFDGTPVSTPDDCPLAISNAWPSNTPCGANDCRVVGAGGTVTIGGCDPGQCGNANGKCSNCCSSIMFILSGATGSNNPNGTYSFEDDGSCIWSDGTEYSYLAKVSGKWRVTFGNATGKIVFVTDCTECPSAVTADWELLSSDFGGTPTFTASASNCASSSSSGGPVVEECGFSRSAAGGNEGFYEEYDIDPDVFEGGTKRFYFSYQTWGAKDRVIVISPVSGVLFDSGCVATGSEQTVPLDLTLADSPIAVEVIPNCEGTSGTSWYFKMTCNERVLLGDMTVTYSWTSNARPDLDMSTVLNITPSQQVGFGCGSGSTYIEFPSGDSDASNGSETALVKLGNAYVDGEWSDSVTVDLHACWYSPTNASDAVSDWTFNITVEWNDVEATTLLSTSALNTTCCGNKVCTVTAYNDGTFTLSCGDGCEPPAAPTVTASWTNMDDDAAVSLTWGAVTGATTYEVQRSYNGGYTWTSLDDAVGTEAYNDSSVCNDCEACYRVRAEKACGSGPFSETKCVTIQPVPYNLDTNGFVSPELLPPQSGSPTQGVKATWVTVGNAPTTTRLYRSTLLATLQSAGGSLITSGGNVQQLDDTSAVADTAYYYGVRLIYADGYAQANVGPYTVCTEPVISDLILTPSGSNGISMTWTVVTAGAEPYYEIYTSTDGTNYSFLAITSSASYLASGLSPSTMYWYVVRGVTYEDSFNHQCRVGNSVSGSEQASGEGMGGGF